MLLPRSLTAGFSARRLLRAGLVLGLVTLAASAFAAERKVTIALPEKVPAGRPITVSIAASTDFGGGEQIGFLHSEYSVDGGKTWKQFTYVTNVGAKTEHGLTFDAGAKGTKVLVRARIAFRGGKAGDVDFAGKKIEWDKTWNGWGEPPTKVASAVVE